MMNTYLLLLSLFFTPFHPVQQSVQDDTSKVNQVIETLFDGMRNSDGDLIRSVITEDVTLQTVVRREDAERLSADMNRFIESVENVPPQTLDERLLSMEIHIDGDLATAWMEYHFYNAGEFSHCGVNTMNLIRKQDGWKIFSIVDTRRREGCL